MIQRKPTNIGKWCIYSYNSLPLVCRIEYEYDNKYILAVNEYNHRVQGINKTVDIVINSSRTLTVATPYVKMYKTLYDAMQAQDKYLILI